ARTVAASAGALSVNQTYRKDGPGSADILVNTSSSGNSGFPFPGGGTAQAQGPGFVDDTSGHIVTNEHVVDGATPIKVPLPNGKATHAFLGVGVANGDGGVRITQVNPDTPADKAGIQVGDIVTSIDGNAVVAASALQTAIDAKKPGDQITVTYKRGGSEKTVK